MIAMALIEKAVSGSVEAIHELTDRVEGKAKTELEFSTPFGEPFTWFSMRDLSDDELRERLRRCDEVLRRTSERPQ